MSEPYKPEPKKMPKGWKSPMRTPLYHVVADWRGEPKPVVLTPGLVREVADEVRAVIAKAIIDGTNVFLSNPTVVLCHV